MKGCGSYLFDGTTYTYCGAMYEKQELLYNSVKDAERVLEIGTYMGHSVFIMLLSNPRLKITCIDIDDTYTPRAIAVLHKYFPDAEIRFIHGHSVTELKYLKDTFDFFHIDGHHENDYISMEFVKIQPLNSRADKVLRVVFDDQSSLQRLQTDIDEEYTVLKKVCPSCKWNNVYYELQSKIT